jgi:hypothetical protein
VYPLPPLPDRVRMRTAREKEKDANLKEIEEGESLIKSSAAKQRDRVKVKAVAMETEEN